MESLALPLTLFSPLPPQKPGQLAAVVFSGVFVGRPAEGGGALAFRGLFQEDTLFPENLYGVLEGSFRQGLGPVSYTHLTLPTILLV